MAEIIDFGKVMSVLLQQGGWYEIDPETFILVPAADCLSGYPGAMPLPGKVTDPW